MDLTPDTLMSYLQTRESGHHGQDLARDSSRVENGEEGVSKEEKGVRGAVEHAERVEQVSANIPPATQKKKKTAGKQNRGR